MGLECDLTIRFGTAGNSLAYLGGGWAPSEPNFTWCVGAESHIMLPRLDVDGEYLITLDVVPFVHAPDLPSQRLIVSVNDAVVGTSTLTRPTLLGFRLARGIVQGSEKVLITLQHPDAARPRDFSGNGDSRELSFSLSEFKVCRVTDTMDAASHLPPGLMLGTGTEQPLLHGGHNDISEWATQRTGLTVPEIAMRFESLGENCEFGLFQRRCDSEPLGLLRFSSTFMRNLIRGIDSGFEGLGTIEDIEPRLEGGPPREFMIHERRYGLVYHTFVYEGQRSVWLMREQESARLKFLLRKFMEELEVAEKIFVYKRDASVSVAEVLPLYAALNRHGDNTLLWVTPATPNRPAGTVEVVRPGLLKGYIDRFAPDDNAHDFSFDGWLRVCANACVLTGLRRQNAKAA